MKYKFILIITTLIHLTSCTEQKKENDLTKENLKGNVKSYETVNYEAVEKFGEIQKGAIMEFLPKRTNFFNKFGNKTEENWTNVFFNQEFKNFSKYDETENIIQHDIYNYSQDKLAYRYIYNYNEKKLQINESLYDSIG